MRMDSFMCKTLILFIVCMALKEGCGLPLSEKPELPAQAPHQHHVRTKRCSCSNWDDKECIYFCHLDIIWVNTPSKLLPYGLGSPSSRRRRSTNRCECLNPADKTCQGFCQNSSEENRTDVATSVVKTPKMNNDSLLASFRSVVKSNMAVLSSKKNTATVNKSRTMR